MSGRCSAKSGSSSPTYTSEPRRINEPQRSASNSEKPTSSRVGLSEKRPPDLQPARAPRLAARRVMPALASPHALRPPGRQHGPPCGPGVAPMPLVPSVAAAAGRLRSVGAACIVSGRRGGAIRQRVLCDLQHDVENRIHHLIEQGNVAVRGAEDIVSDKVVSDGVAELGSGHKGGFH